MDNDDCRAREIARLNDEFRRTGTGGRILMTATVHTLPYRSLRELARKVRTFCEFTADNDPHGEHDFGALVHEDVSYFWKIDYYDVDHGALSRDPADPMVTNRVLTIMRADEY